MARLLMTIPYDIGGNLGREYNSIMQNTTHEWIGFADHDLFFANPQWYLMFSHAIKNLPDAGFISCKTNRVGCPLQKAGAERNNDIEYHRRRAKELHTEYWNDYEDVTQSQFVPSGLVFVTSRKAWQEVGGFRESGIIGVDTNYVNKLKRAKYKIIILRGLYVFHWYRGAK